MKLKEYMSAKKLREAANKEFNIVIGKKGDGKKNGNSKRKRKNHNNDSQGN